MKIQKIDYQKIEENADAIVNILGIVATVATIAIKVIDTIRNFDEDEDEDKRLNKAFKKTKRKGSRFRDPIRD